MKSARDGRRVGIRGWERKVEGMNVVLEMECLVVLYGKDDFLIGKRKIGFLRTTIHSRRRIGFHALLAINLPSPRHRVP